MILLVILVFLLFLIAGSVILATLRLSIPPMPSNRMMRAKAGALLRDYGGTGPVTDLGSGWGGFARSLALAFPDRQVRGMELSLVPFFCSRAVCALAGPGNLSFARKNVLKEPLVSGSTYVCYLSTMHMTRLSRKITDEGFTGTIISLVFALHGVQPEVSSEIDDFYRSRIYVYRFD